MLKINNQYYPNHSSNYSYWNKYSPQTSPQTIAVIFTHIACYSRRVIFTLAVLFIETQAKKHFLCYRKQV